MKKQPDLTAQTRQNLIDAFWVLYCKKGIEKITIKEITDKAGYNRSTFYQYFVDVYDVLDQIEKSLIPTIDELPPRNMPDQSVKTSFNMFLKLYEEKEKYYNVLLGDHGDPAFTTKMKNAMKPLIFDAVSNGTSKNEVELDFIIEFILSAMINIVSYWFQKDKVLPAEDLIAIMYKLMDNDLMKNLTE